MDNNRLTKIVFLEEIFCGKAGWYQGFTKVCNLAGFNMPSDLTSTISIKDFMQKCKQYHITECKEKIKHQAKLEVYREVITQYGNIKLLDGILKKEEHSLVCQLLWGNLKLNVELGRYNDKPRHQTFCTLCNTNSVENCYHFQFDCPALVLPRKLMYDTLKWDLSHINSLTNSCKLVVLLTDHVNVFKKYVRDIWHMRRNVLNKNC